MISPTLSRALGILAALTKTRSGGCPTVLATEFAGCMWPAYVNEDIFSPSDLSVVEGTTMLESLRDLHLATFDGKGWTPTDHPRVQLSLEDLDPADYDACKIMSEKTLVRIQQVSRAAYEVIQALQRGPCDTERLVRSLAKKTGIHENIARKVLASVNTEDCISW